MILSRRRYMGKVESGGIKLMDYLFTDGSIGKTIGNKIPVAIAVAPASHFTDGKWRFMSLKSMSTETTSGDLLQTLMTWGKYGQQVTGLTLYGRNIAKINSDGTFNSIVNGGYLPQTRVYNEYGCQNLLNGWYYTYNTGSYAPAPPPFLNDNITKNDVYFTEGQLLCDIDGSGNTDILVTYTDTTYKACKAARNFAPGIYDGEWYLPAAGELGYIVCQRKAIDDAIDAANAIVTECGVKPSGRIWASTQSFKDAAIAINLGNGHPHDEYKHANTASVRAFIKI